MPVAIVPPPLDSRNHLGHQDIHSGNEYGEDCQEVLFFTEPIPNWNSVANLKWPETDRKITRLIENISAGGIGVGRYFSID